MQTTPYLAIESGATLVILEMEQIRSCALDVRTQWKLGRSCPGNSPDIPLQSPIAGRKHGELICIDGQWFYVDGGSINGTFHNGKKVDIGLNNKKRPVLLNNGDILRIDYSDLSTPDSRGVWMLFTTDTINGAWQVYSLKNRTNTIIGRDPEECDIVQEQGYISAKHAKITYLNGNYYLSDCGSKAGVWLNKKRINESVILREKDKFSLCDCHFIFTGNSLLYNKQNRHSVQSGKIVLKADIKSKVVANNKGFGKKELLRNVKLDIKEGSLVALLGGSGAGKTTLIDCLNGMDLKGVTGTVLFYGEDMYQNFERLKYMIGSISQDNVFHPTLTVEENLKEAATIRLFKGTTKRQIEERVKQIIDTLGLQKVAKSKVQKLSGGEKKRVHIGIELVADRKLLCIDEPDAGQDPATKHQIFSILRKEAHENGKSIIVIIHDVSEIDLFDQVIMLAKVDNVGRLAFAGTPDEARKYFGMDIKEAYDALSKSPEKYVKG